MYSLHNQRWKAKLTEENRAAQNKRTNEQAAKNCVRKQMDGYQTKVKYSHDVYTPHISMHKSQSGGNT